MVRHGLISRSGPTSVGSATLDPLGDLSCPASPGRKDVTALPKTFKPEPVLPAGQRDDGAGALVIIGGLPRGLALVIERRRSATDHFIEVLFLVKRKGVPSRTDVDPQQVGHAGRTIRPVNALLGIGRQCRFGLLGLTG